MDEQVVELLEQVLKELKTSNEICKAVKERSDTHNEFYYLRENRRMLFDKARALFDSCVKDAWNGVMEDLANGDSYVEAVQFNLSRAAILANKMVVTSLHDIPVTPEEGKS